MSQQVDLTVKIIDFDEVEPIEIVEAVEQVEKSKKETAKDLFPEAGF